MSYPNSPVVGHRRSSRYDHYRSGSREYSAEREKSRRRDRPREANGYDGRYEDDRRPSLGRYESAGPTRYAGEVRGRGPNAAAPKPSRVLGVFGLSLRTEERHLYDVMSAYGSLEDIQIVYDSLTGRSRGFAFVYFQNVEDARAARAACARGLELHDRIVRVDYSLTTAPHQPTPGVYMGKDKRRGFPDRNRRYGYFDRRPRPYRRSRSRSRSPRRSRVTSSSRSRSPPREDYVRSSKGDWSDRSISR